MTTLLNQLNDFSYGSQNLSKITSKSSSFMLNDQSDQLDVIKNKKNFTVAVRIKPQFNSTPSSLINLSVKRISQKSQQLKLNFQGRRYEYNSYGQNGQKKFVFDKVYQSESQNQQIFSSLIQKKLEMLHKGVNLSIMAYGATNSGKTYTIFGKQQNQSSKNNVYGLSYMTFKRVFQMYRQNYNVAFSFVQIYNQNVYDLLNPLTVTNSLNVMEDSQGNTNVIGLNKIQILSAQELQKLITSGNEARISCSNLQNIHSSRSHAFMELQLKHKITKQRTRMVIVDLAGSEKYLYNSTSNGTNLLKEGSNINKSLLSLGNCIKSLYQNDQHIPYRDSKLTRLLKENLSGYAHNIMIACINKKICNFEQNMNSLNYALKAIKIEKQIVRKVRSQELSEYQCSMCHQKLPYSLIKEINKHQQHRKRVKTRESQSLSISPIAKISSQFLPFKSQSVNSTIKSNYKKFEKIIDEAFQSIFLKMSNGSISPQTLGQILEEEKKVLKTEMKEQVFTSKFKNQQKLDSSSNQITVSEFDSPSQITTNESQIITQRNHPPTQQRRLKISLSKPKKQLQNTAASNNSQLSNDNISLVKNFESQVDKQYNSTKNYIKIEDEPLEQDSSILNSFRSKLSLQILNDKEKILNERKRVLQQTSYNQRRNSAQSMNIIKFKSTQNNLKTKNIENFISATQSNPQNKIKFKSTSNNNHMKIDQYQENSKITSFDEFMINQKMLDSTSIAPRMKRDEEELGAWKNIVIKNIQSPIGLFANQKSQIQESFVQQRVNASDQRRDNLFNDQRRDNLFRACRY